MKSSPKRLENALWLASVELLIAEEDHQMLEQGLADLGDGGIVEHPAATSTPPISAPRAPAIGETVMRS